MTGTTRTDFLNTLSADSDALKDLATSFRNRLRNLEIVTFYETEITPPLAELVRTPTPHVVRDLTDIITRLGC